MCECKESIPANMLNNLVEKATTNIYAKDFHSKRSCWNINLKWGQAKLKLSKTLCED